MIVCVVDDLIFSIKISTAARRLGVDMYFERSRDNVLQTVRDKQPSLVIFDLNSTKLAPMDAIVALKADAALRQIRTVGYVSHVDTATIERARAAGIDQVMARSAFSEKLGEILQGQTPRSQSTQGA
jgi:CheY-like chemotaxis protein